MIAIVFLLARLFVEAPAADRARNGASRRRSPQGAARDRDGVRRMATIARLLERRRAERDRIRELLEGLARSGLMTAAGEAQWLPRLDARLAEADRLLEGVERTPDPARDLDRLDANLKAVEWDVADGIVRILEDKRRAQEAVVGGFRETVDAWKQRLEPLRAAIIEAFNANAPVRVEEARFKELEALVAQVDRALQDQRYADIGEPLAKLRVEEATPSELIPRVLEKQQAAARFLPRADVLLLRSPIKDRHSYTVLLRTPSAPERQSINIQGSSTVVDQDRQYVRRVVDQITSATNQGLFRRFSAVASASTPAQPTADASTTDGADPRAGADESPDAGGVAPTLREWDPSVPPDPLTPLAETGSVSELIREVGDVMFRLIMPDPMRQYLALNPCSLTITTNDLELPWELMHDNAWDEPRGPGEDGFLCLLRPVARMPMGRAFPRIHRERQRSQQRLRFLFVHADPSGQLQAARAEIGRIREGLEKRWNAAEAQRVEITVLEGEAATGEALNRALLSGAYDVIHFAGHAGFDEQDPDLSGLILHKSETFFSQKIQRFLEGHPLVFLNACETGRSANESSAQRVGEYFWKPAEGLASAFLYGGALGCVGSLWPIFDEPAADFAVSFYNEVLEGQTLGEAMRQARRQLKAANPDAITWASFVLYGDPTFRLVR